MKEEDTKKGIKNREEKSREKLTENKSRLSGTCRRSKRWKKVRKLMMTKVEKNVPACPV